MGVRSDAYVGTGGIPFEQFLSLKPREPFKQAEGA